MSPRTKFRLAMGVVAILIATGTIGYKLILGLPWFDCFYFTLITITTIGFGEPEGMTEPARYFTAFLIITGVSTIGYALSIAARAVLEFELVATFGKRRMFKDISKLRDHYIICGAGRIGSRVIREIARREEDFFGIEGDEKKGEKMGSA